MKRLLFSGLFCALLSLQVMGQQTTVPPPAEIILKEAYREASEQNKNVLLMFHASWCGWCHRMDTSINDPVCKKFFMDNYVICHLVVDESAEKKKLENPGADELRKKYNGDGQGIPFWLIFDKEGRLLADSKIRTTGQGPAEGENVGCPASEEEVSYFINVLKMTSPLNDQQLEVIRKRFRENEK